MQITCLMMTSVDGKILTANWGGAEGQYSKIYESVHEGFDSDAWICGRVTMEKDFSGGHSPQPKSSAGPVPRTDHVADPNAESFAIAVDPSGKLGWKKSEIEGDHIIEVLTEGVSDGYLAYLQEAGISYLFGGKQELDFKVVTQKLSSLFGIQHLMVEGGGGLNGSFLKAGLIDELHLVVLPLIDGSADSTTAFETGGSKGAPTGMELIQVDRMEDGALHLKYKVGQRL